VTHSIDGRIHAYFGNSKEGRELENAGMPNRNAARIVALSDGQKWVKLLPLFVIPSEENDCYGNTSAYQFCDETQEPSLPEMRREDQFAGNAMQALPRSPRATEEVVCFQSPVFQ
jgi:hypothetical protein